MIQKHIIALGGGGFSEGTWNSVVDDYLIKASSKSHPHIVFIPTASDNSTGYIKKFEDAFSSRKCSFSHILMDEMTYLDRNSIKEIKAADIFFVGGGNTSKMLNVWEKCAFDIAIKEEYHKGKVLAGISAGAICWFEYGLTDSLPPGFRKMKCMGFIKGVMSPHFDSEPERQPAFELLTKSSDFSIGYTCDDGVAIHFINGIPNKIVKENSYSKACIYRKVDNGTSINCY